jgi:hypothetical protein
MPRKSNSLPEIDELALAVLVFERMDGPVGLNPSGGERLGGKAGERSSAHRLVADMLHSSVSDIGFGEFEKVHGHGSLLAAMAEGIALEDRSPLWALALRRRSNEC